MLEVDDLSISFGGLDALSGLSLQVTEREIFALIGPNGAGKSTVFNVVTGLDRPSRGRVGANGAGKSTTLRAVSGLVRPVRGRIVYEGRDITQAPADAIVSAGVGHVPEGREIFPEFTVLENLLVGGHTVRRSQIGERLDAAFELFPVLGRRRSQLAGTLSGGEQQMLAIGRPLVARPRLLLLDEPSLGLAPLLSREIFGVIRRINAGSVAVLLVEQNARRALALAARGYVLETGRLVVEGPSAALAADPRVRRAYLGLDRVLKTAP